MAQTRGVYPRRVPVYSTRASRPPNASRATRSPEDRFWAKVQKSPGCWLWTAATNRGDGTGYGVFYVSWPGGRYYAHRYSWELANGRKVPSGMEVMHACDIKRCVRPDHLAIGTHLDNMRDAFRKGIHAHGETCGHSTITEDVAAAILARGFAGEPAKAIAQGASLPLSLVRHIVKRRTWRHLPLPVLGASR